MSSSAYGDINKAHTEDDGRYGFDANGLYPNSYMQAIYPAGSLNQQHPDTMYSPYMYASDGRGGPPAPPNGTGVWSNSGGPNQGPYSTTNQLVGSAQQHNYMPAEYYGIPQAYSQYPMTAPSQYSSWGGSNPAATLPASTTAPGGAYGTADISPWAYKSMGNGSDLDHSSQMQMSSSQRDYYNYSQQPQYASYRTPGGHDMGAGNNNPGMGGLDIHHAATIYSTHQQSSVPPNVATDLVGHNGITSSASSLLLSPQQPTHPSNSSVDLNWRGVEQSFNTLNIHGSPYSSGGVNGVDDSLSTVPISSSASARIAYNLNTPVVGIEQTSNLFSTPMMSNTNNHSVTSASTTILDVTNGPGAFLGANNGGLSKSHTAPLPVVPQKKTWATIASQPAKGSAATMGQAPAFQSNKKSPVSAGFGGAATYAPSGGGNRSNLSKSSTLWESSSSNNNNKSSNRHNYNSSNDDSTNVNNGQSCGTDSIVTTDGDGVLDLAAFAKSINPKNFDINPKKARFFVIKSYSEDDIHRSIKYSIWCSTDHGNKKLDSAFKELAGSAPVYLFFSVNGSGHFCGMARMVSLVDYDTQAGVWSQDKWKGQFRVQWIYVKDVPNNHLRHIRLETNENKPVTNSRDATEVPLDKGKAVLKVIHSYRHTTSIFDDFTHYERREEQECHKKP